MRKGNFREKNGFWKGGRSVASNGYVLIKVGFDHHLADVRGYAYEHRLNAEKKIGRRLLAGEMVHHINGIKTDNREENLEVCASNAEHLFHHRIKESDRRMPNQDNPKIQCHCGCGKSLTVFDSTGRPRKYISGHNPSQSPTMDKVKTILKNGPLRRTQIAEKANQSLTSIATCLSKMKNADLIENLGGFWRLKDGKK